jgi:predicted nuclease of restriction endonuclease-like RecB superfamily
LKVRRTKTAIHPLFTTDDKRSLAKTLISIYKDAIDHKRWVLNAGLQSCEELGYDYRLVRGLSFILDSHCIFSSRSVITPEKLRPMLFAEAARTPVYTDADRVIVVDRVAKALGVEPPEVDESMYADLLEEQTLTDFDEPEPIDLLGYYNHSLTATVLTHSVRIEMEYLDKSEVVEKTAEMLGDFECRGTSSSRITLLLKPLKQVTARGAKMERLLTALIHTRGWSLNADILYPVRLNETRPLTLSQKLHGNLLKAKVVKAEVVIEIPDKPQKRSSYGEIVVLEDTANKLGITDRELLKLIEAEGVRFVKLSGVVYSPSKLEAIKAELENMREGDLKDYKVLLKGHGVKNVVAVLESLGYVVEPGDAKELHVYRLRRKPSSI